MNALTCWKTTAGGLLGAGGLLFSQWFPEWSRYGLFAAALGHLITGFSARDYDKSSEQVGLNTDKQP